MRPDIVLSWQRSRQCGVDPGAAVGGDPDSDVESGDRLLHAAKPILDELASQLTDSSLCVLLADSDGRIVDRVFGDRTMAQRIERAGVVVGSRLGEDEVGTNALGTPLELRRAIIVNGAEHYLERFKQMSCCGQPIIHPATQRVEGVLDITGISDQANPLFAPLVARAVADIEGRLQAGRRAAQQRLMDAFQRISARPGAAVAAISGDLVLANPAALELLGPVDYQNLRDITGESHTGRIKSGSIELSCGERALVEAERVPGTNNGAVFVVRADRSAPRISRGSIPLHTAGARIKDRLRVIRGATGAVLVCGEPGSGRTTAVADLVEGSTPCLDAATAAVAGTRAWLRTITEQLATRPAFLVIENVDCATTEAIALLTEMLSMPHPTRLVLTSPPVTELSPAVAALVARCPHRIDLPPLRNRSNEIDDIARHMFDGIRPGLRVTARAASALRAATWPGNLTELRAVLTTAAGTCPSGRIDLADLPEPYRVSPRIARLSERELAERRVIIEALERCGGNKVHAARQLGMSRTTLYARMRMLDIDR